MGTIANDVKKAGRARQIRAAAARDNHIPALYEDEGLEMGEAEVHKRTTDIIFYGLEFHFSAQKRYRVFSDLNLFYDPEDPAAYVSPDVMVVELRDQVPGGRRSYRIHQDGPAPLATIEVLSFRTFQQGDLTYKPEVYSRVGTNEYILVDVTGEFLAEKLLLKARQADGSWRDRKDADGGTTSALRFRLVLENDGQVRVIDCDSGRRYPRPDEALSLQERLAELEQKLEQKLAKGKPGRKRR